MARGNRASDHDNGTELNLAPIMNMVVILIPLLLLSIVFLKVGVINITTPTLGPAVQSDVVPEEALNLTVAINDQGFRIVAANQPVPAVGSCPQPGPTVCLNTPGDKPEFSAQMNGAALDGALAAYDWKQLYNELVRIKKAHGSETTINITADPGVPYAAIVRVMDVARFRLQADTYDDNSSFWSARYASSGSQYATLFPDPVLSIAR